MAIVAPVKRLKLTALSAKEKIIIHYAVSVLKIKQLLKEWTSEHQEASQLLKRRKQFHRLEWWMHFGLQQESFSSIILDKSNIKSGKY